MNREDFLKVLKRVDSGDLTPVAAAAFFYNDLNTTEVSGLPVNDTCDVVVEPPAAAAQQEPQTVRASNWDYFHVNHAWLQSFGTEALLGLGLTGLGVAPVIYERASVTMSWEFAEVLGVYLVQRIAERKAAIAGSQAATA